MFCVRYEKYTITNTKYVSIPDLCQLSFFACIYFYSLPVKGELCCLMLIFKKFGPRSGLSEHLACSCFKMFGHSEIALLKDLF